MELKETKSLATKASLKLHARPERNNSDAQGIYNILFSDQERLGEQDIDGEFSNKERGKPMFGEVSTLDWIKTWRVLEIS